jgi:hypothetical protein
MSMPKKRRKLLDEGHDVMRAGSAISYAPALKVQTGN